MDHLKDEHNSKRTHGKEWEQSSDQHVSKSISVPQALLGHLNSGVRVQREQLGNGNRGSELQELHDVEVVGKGLDHTLRDKSESPKRVSVVDHEQSSASSKGEDDEHNNGLSSNTIASSDAISGNKDGIRGTLSAKNSNLVSSTLRGRASILDGSSGRSSSRDTDGSLVVSGHWQHCSTILACTCKSTSGQHSGRISPVVPEDADLSSSRRRIP